MSICFTLRLEDIFAASAITTFSGAVYFYFPFDLINRILLQARIKHATAQGIVCMPVYSLNAQEVTRFIEQIA